MKVLALEPVGGIAGDMLLGALLHAGAPRKALDAGLAELKLEGVEVRATPVEVSGIRALHVEVVAPEHGHAHTPWRAIRAKLESAHIAEGARRRALDAFARLAAAEGSIHGVAPDDVEFHEVGAVDSIVDVVGCALLIEALGPARIACLAPPSGGGTVKSAHGVIPVPAPATVELLRGRAMRPSGPGERTTPTGAAMIASWTEPADALPELIVDAVGYGAGTRRWDDAPNVLRAVLGRAPPGSAGELLEITANLDDLSPQLLAVALEAALAAGALDAWVSAATMKKGRPGHVLSALVSPAARPAVEAALFRETSTLGLRAHRVERRLLERELVEVATAYGPVRVKVGKMGGEAVNAAPEFEDCRAAARKHGAAVKEVMAAALSAWRALRG